MTKTTTEKAQDLYPSRVAPEPSLMDRRDPVVHGEATGALTRYQRDAYQADGFLAFSGFFPLEEVRELQKEGERLRNRDDLRGREDVITEPESDEIRSIFRVHRRSDLFDRVTRDRRILSKVQEILGGDVYIHQSRINYKPGFTGREFYWHSDFETWHVEDGMPRMRAVSCSIALTPNYEFNGPLMLVPGSHQYFLSTVGETPEDHYKESLKKQEIGVPDAEGLEKLIELGGGIEVPKGPAGSVTLFECNTMHGSASNITPFARTNLFVVYNSVDNRLVEPFSGQRPRPGYLGERDAVEPLRSAS
ncbi:MAG TPA: ectoine hydroxylase [Thermoanaerobaculia bacterium]|nr:ectoine hydroxylase [Thermoanaerobaculia bacterium]